MIPLPLPPKVIHKKKNQAVFEIEGLYPGYGVTIGNALRRVLLSSLQGAAITEVKIKGAPHEFSTIPYVKEDAVEISLNLKQLRLKVFSEEPVRLELKAKGEKKVTAKDIKTTSDVEIVNPELVIATLTNKEAEFDMEILVSQGRGYIPTESREKENVEIDMIIIDAIFTPIKNVGIKIENIRVGQMTNYENLILNIETDGSLTPQEALNQANQILIDHFQFVDEQIKTTTTPTKVKKEKEKEQTEETKKITETEAVAEKEEIKTPKKRGRKPKAKIAEEKKEGN